MVNLFETQHKRYLKIYAPRIPTNSLDPALFEFPDGTGVPKLSPPVYDQLMTDLMQICNNERFRAVNVFIVGPCLEKGADKRCEVRVLVQLNKDVMDGEMDGALGERLLGACKTCSNRLLPGTQHQVVYTPTIRTISLDEYPAAYSLLDNRWAKTPDLT